MLNNRITQDYLFNELKPFADSLGLSLVEVRKNVRGADEVNVAIVIQSNSGDTSIDDCEKFHRTVQSRLELVYGRDQLSMEVSTPGLQRTFNDVWEFEVFKGKRCRVYDLSRSQWIEGDINSSVDGKVVLDNCVIEDTSETFETMSIGFENVQKAKLEYKFKEKKDKNGDK